MKAKDPRANIKAPAIITLFSENLRRHAPTINLDINDDIPKMPTSTPISLSPDPNLAR
jgi:hypothetical protein